MRIRFHDLNVLAEGGEVEPVIRSSLAECADETERSLWEMHEKAYSRTWTCGKVVAERI